MNRQHFNNDPRWQWVDQISDLLAILASVETHRRFVQAHAAHANMHNVVLNLRQILDEVNGMNSEITKLRTRLGQMQDDLIQAIYRTDRGDAELLALRSATGSADQGHAYLITESRAGRRVRRVRLSDYVREDP